MDHDVGVLQRSTVLSHILSIPLCHIVFFFLCDPLVHSRDPINYILQSGSTGTGTWFHSPVWFTCTHVNDPVLAYTVHSRYLAGTFRPIAQERQTWLAHKGEVWVSFMSSKSARSFPSKSLYCVQYHVILYRDISIVHRIVDLKSIKRDIMHRDKIVD